MHAKSGSNPGGYLYDHPLNDQRAQMTKQWGAQAAAYFAGPGVVNPRAGEILAENTLAPRVNEPEDTSMDFLSAGLAAYVRHKQTKGEAQAREDAAQADAERKKAALQYMKVSNVRFENTSDGKRGVFADITNGSNVLMKRVVVTFYYVSPEGRALHNESVALDGLPSGRTGTTGVYLRAVPGYKDVRVGVTDLDY